jgi:cellulose synthase/poly-beta-1,6-N-acetylglucosamine synthase-like glycosyltransferase
MSESVEVSVIVPVRNGEHLLPRCLEALRKQQPAGKDFEIIVVDDGSGDNTSQVAESAGARVLRQSPQGPAAARNRGVEEARGAIVLFTDADCAPCPDWMEKMLAPFEDVSIAGVKGAYISSQRSLTARFVQREYESKYQRMADFDRIDFIDTYSAGFRREVFQKAGGYDTSFETASVEDQEFSFRLHRLGISMVFVPEARVEHLHVSRFRGYVRKKFKIGYYKALLLRKHPDRVKGDTHTPRSLTAQMVFCAAFAAGLFMAAVSGFMNFGTGVQISGMMTAGAAAGFLISCIPFWLELAAKKDRAVLLVSPFMLAGRAAALGSGLATGLIRFTLGDYFLPSGCNREKGA